MKPTNQITPLSQNISSTSQVNSRTIEINGEAPEASHGEIDLTFPNAAQEVQQQLQEKLDQMARSNEQRAGSIGYGAGVVIGRIMNNITETYSNVTAIFLQRLKSYLPSNNPQLLDDILNTLSNVKNTHLIAFERSEKIAKIEDPEEKIKAQRELLSDLKSMSGVNEIEDYLSDTANEKLDGTHFNEMRVTTTAIYLKIYNLSDATGDEEQAVNILQRIRKIDPLNRFKHHFQPFYQNKDYRDHTAYNRIVAAKLDDVAFYKAAIKHCAYNGGSDGSKTAFDMFQKLDEKISKPEFLLDLQELKILNQKIENSSITPQEYKIKFNKAVRKLDKDDHLSMAAGITSLRTKEISLIIDPEERAKTQKELVEVVKNLNVLREIEDSFLDIVAKSEKSSSPLNRPILDIYSNLEKIYDDLNDDEAATDVFRKMVKIDPEIAEIRRIQTRDMPLKLFESKQDREKQVRTLERIAKVKPDLKWIYEDIGSVYHHHLTNPGKAHQYHSAEIERHPNHISYSQRSQLLEESFKDIAGAQEDMKKAIELCDDGEIKKTCEKKLLDLEEKIRRTEKQVRTKFVFVATISAAAAALIGAVSLFIYYKSRQVEVVDRAPEQGTRFRPEEDIKKAVEFLAKNTFEGTLILDCEDLTPEKKSALLKLSSEKTQEIFKKVLELKLSSTKKIANIGNELLTEITSNLSNKDRILGTLRERFEYLGQDPQENNTRVLATAAQQRERLVKQYLDSPILNLSENSKSAELTEILGNLIEMNYQMSRVVALSNGNKKSFIYDQIVAPTITAPNHNNYQAVNYKTVYQEKLEGAIEIYSNKLLELIIDTHAKVAEEFSKKKIAATDLLEELIAEAAKKYEEKITPEVMQLTRSTQFELGSSLQIPSIKPESPTASELAISKTAGHGFEFC